MSTAERGGLVNWRTWPKPSARAICAQGVASSAYLYKRVYPWLRSAGGIVERRGAPLQSNFSAQVKDREINRNEVVFRHEGPLRRALDIGGQREPENRQARKDVTIGETLGVSRMFYVFQPPLTGYVPRLLHIGRQILSPDGNEHAR